MLRPQRYRENALASHFRLLALCSAGRDLGSSRSEAEALGAHIGFYVSAVRAFLGPSFHLRVTVTDWIRRGEPEPAVRDAAAGAVAGHERVEIVLDPDREAGRGYYSGPCFHVLGQAEPGRLVQLADGGAVSWTQQYLSNSKERLVVSGLGSERVCSLRSRADPS